ncbi:MAG: O-acetylhomoserine aminocarboxypropyltransferase/cysteine synthase [Fibrobacteria bacterium]|nr:O-acetylhomoserine aminocarboxypropyltransferase/cysteine synthase [Fibrobacteria bacterium]
MTGFATKAIHNYSAKATEHGTLRVPVYDSVAFAYADAESMQLAFEGKRPTHSYSRISNPTVTALEQKVQELSKGLSVIAFSSGMAAISTTILGVAGAGDNIVISKYLFGNTLSLFCKTLAPWGLKVKMVDITDLGALENAIDDNTRAVFIESISNPQMQVPDVSGIASITQDKKVLLIMDNTVTTPYLFNTKEAGVDLEVISSTKYMSGGATCVGGLLIDNGSYNWKHNPKLSTAAQKYGPFTFIASLRQEVFRNLGTCMAPHNAYLQLLGIESMTLRIDKSCSNAQALAECIDKLPGVQDVFYPGLPSSPYYEIAKKQFGGLFGGILTFALSSKEKCFRMVNALQIIKRATNINDNKSLIIHPASTIFCEYGHDELLEIGVTDNLLRLSVGIEDVDDLIKDLKQALEAC